MFIAFLTAVVLDVVSAACVIQVDACCLGFKSLLDWDFFCIQVIRMIVKKVTPGFNRPSLLLRSLVDSIQ